MKLFQTPGTKNIKDDWGPKGRKFIIDIKKNNARIAGVTNQDIAVSLQTALDGFQAGEGQRSILEYPAEPTHAAQRTPVADAAKEHLIQVVGI